MLAMSNYDPPTSRTPGMGSYGEADTTVLPAVGSEITGAPRRRAGWHAGADVGLLVLRLVLGAIFIGHGSRKLFGLFGGPGIDGFADVLAGYGYVAPGALAVLTGVTEFVGGALVLLGLVTPLAAAALVGVMVNTISLKLGSGFFAADGGFELDLALAGMAAALALAGPGRVALDRGTPWFRHPVVSGWICLLLGIGAGIVFAVVLRG